MQAHPEVLDVLELSVPTGGRVLVVSDLHLGQNATEASEATASELAKALDSWEGPGVVVLAGDCFELLGEPHNDPARALTAHPRLTAALRSYGGGQGRHVVVLAGNHDGALGWSPRAVDAVTGQIGARVAFTLELELVTGAGTKRVRVEHGNRFDPANAFADPRDPAETPIGHHIVTEVLPLLSNGGPELAWVADLGLIADPGDTAAFVSSRLFYRRVLPAVLWLLTPLFLAAVIAAVRPLLGFPLLAGAERLLAIAGAAVIVAVLIGSAWWVEVVGRPLRQLQPDLSGGAEPGNDAPRAQARALVGAGLTGLVTGHTHRAELVDLGGGFYANSGCGGKRLHRRPGRLGLPPVFTASRHTSWVSMDVGPELRVELHIAHHEVPSTTLLERLLSRPAPIAGPKPSVVTSWPGGEPWPPPQTTWLRRRRIRRGTALLILGAGLLNLFSAVTPPLRSRLGDIADVFPLAVSQAAAVLTVLAGVALLLLARGVRRGQHHAWLLATGLLLLSAVLHLVKGLDLEEGLTALVLALWLLSHHAQFRVRSDVGATRRSLRILVVGALVSMAAGVFGTEVFSGRRGRLPLRTALFAVAERMVGSTSVELPQRIDRFLVPTLVTTSIALVGAAGWSLFRPVIAARLAAKHPDETGQARRIVTTYGGDTLAYFALRDDKRWFFWGESLVAYAIYQGICLVSPDPIGPVAQRREVWAAFRDFADDHGWSVAVMGAAEEWLPIYRASGMRDIYVGDEAVVDVRRFSLEGGRNKGLRQAVNRVAKKGYTIEFHDPAVIDDELRRELQALMRESRRGDVERGFSMTLSRVFDPADSGLLLAVCRGPDGTPAAFCHFVPAAAINGFSLDLMRRSAGEHPNGLTDFVVVRTIEHLRAGGMVGLGLNFAVMRSVLADERGDSVSLRLQKWLLGRLSDSMQIESLWRFNAKFDPDWVPRYAVYDTPESLLSSALAVARAESFWELPVIGRIFRPSAPSTVADDDPSPVTEAAAPPVTPAAADQSSS